MVILNGLDLDKIYNSGQVFTWIHFGDDYIIHSREYRVQAHKCDGVWHIFPLNHECGEKWKNELKYWRHYFDIHYDYQNANRVIRPDDTYLQNAATLSKGMCILNQDPWDTMICFIISQNNNIKRIRNSVHKMIQQCGRVPTAEDIIEKRIGWLSQFSLGYRDEYIWELAKYKCIAPAFWDATISSCYRNRDFAYENLMLRKGIGAKVANCICLFAFHHIDAFPIDTHVRQILKEHYPDGLPNEYAPVAGILQQYMFYYETNKKSLEKAV